MLLISFIILDRKDPGAEARESDGADSKSGDDQVNSNSSFGVLLSDNCVCDLSKACMFRCFCFMVQIKMQNIGVMIIFVQCQSYGSP